MKTFLAGLVLATSVVVSFAAETNATLMSPSAARDSRCFELRTYYAPPGKMEALNARFRDHTFQLFRKHGMEIIGFWIPTEKEHANKLVYLLAHKSREAAEKSWDAFKKDPEWLKVRSESEVNGKLTEKIESIYMSATDYSPLK